MGTRPPGAGPARIPPMLEDRPLRAPERSLTPLLLGVVLLLLGVHLFVFATRPIDSWGYDESTHVELPAARLILSGSWNERLEVIGQCDRYPPLVPLVQALGQAAFGLGETVARRIAFVLGFGGTLVGLFVLGRGLARRLSLTAELPLLMLLLAELSPLLARFAPTLFLEVPFLAVATWTLVAWMARQGPAPGCSRLRELLAGAAVSAAFFTKFNYGLLLVGALALDWLLETVGEWRVGRLRAQLQRSTWLALPPLFAFLSWFVRPPGGITKGESHWEALRAYLSGNQELAATGAARRLLDWGLQAFAHPAWLLLVLLALGAALFARSVDRGGRLPPCVRCLWLLLFALVVPPMLHPFHLERFLLPGLLPIWALAAIGATAFTPRVRVSALSLTALVALGLPRHLWAGALGFLAAPGELREQQVRVIDHDLGLWGRVPTAGLARSNHERLADWVFEEAGVSGRVAWIGMSPEFSPAALHLALLERGGSVERFLADAHRPMDILPTAGAPAPEAGERARRGRVGRLLEWADVVFMTSPPDLKGRPRPQFEERWQKPVVDAGWIPREVGRLGIERLGEEPLEVILFSLHPPAGRGGAGGD